MKEFMTFMIWMVWFFLALIVARILILLGAILAFKTFGITSTFVLLMAGLTVMAFFFSLPVYYLFEEEVKAFFYDLIGVETSDPMPI